MKFPCRQFVHLAAGAAALSSFLRTARRKRTPAGRSGSWCPYHPAGGGSIARVAQTLEQVYVFAPITAAAGSPLAVGQSPRPAFAAPQQRIEVAAHGDGPAVGQGHRATERVRGRD
jgi:hypothetical protein